MATDRVEIERLTDLVEESLATYGEEMDPLRLAAIFALHIDRMPAEWLARLAAERADELAQVGVMSGVHSSIIDARQHYAQRIADDISMALIEISIESGDVEREGDGTLAVAAPRKPLKKTEIN
jgi:hypothetical protein